MNVTSIKIKRLLELLYSEYNSHLSSDDPIWHLKNLKSEADIEIAAFVISCYTYGNIKQIKVFIDKFFKLTNKSPYKFILEFNKSQISRISDFAYRFNTNDDFVTLLLTLKSVFKKYGSLKKLYLKYYSPYDINIIPSLHLFTSAIRNGIPHSKTFDYLIPDVNKNSTCKRLNLFLRWMVRKDNIDFGLWNKEISTSKLIIPVDIHVYKLSQKLKLVNRKSCDIKYAVELTNKLKEFDNIDPVKYDFALCHNEIDRKINLI